jgi:6-pyruvoyltetrahydropterin/6-carboxytetrahydropterin synthase
MRSYTVTVQSTFSAAHMIRGYRGTCERLHGHNWKVEMSLRRGELDETGLSVDFREAKRVLGEVLEALDHRVLNEVPPFDRENPSAENLARHVFEEARKRLPVGEVLEVVVWESESSRCAYRES